VDTSRSAAKDGQACRSDTAGASMMSMAMIFASMTVNTIPP
jgi:hypothetical protein